MAEQSVEKSWVEWYCNPVQRDSEFESRYGTKSAKTKGRVTAVLRQSGGYGFGDWDSLISRVIGGCDLGLFMSKSWVSHLGRDFVPFSSCGRHVVSVGLLCWISRVFVGII